ncbi:sacsin-like [Sycon ciliatum]|uniref:sacsin-like n=1 Tax=Sycon ciliatum TaxID=27933 RepID=UPI0031F6DEEA
MSASGGSCHGTYVSVKPPPLITFIKNVLKDYPDGGQTLKELLQNANDAGATRVQFLLNCEQYSDGDLIHANMASMQGPALYEYNDGVFRGGDWKGICRPSRSKKKKDVMKVGRFGIGFNSVYHLTDVPAILSGTSVGFIDPILCHIRDPSSTDTDSDDDDDSDDDQTNATSAKRCVMQELVKFPVQGFAGSFPGQASTFNVLEHQLTPCEESFTGTLFRFPLRQDQDSLLSKTIYSEEDVEKKLFASFQKEADIMLLFLANIRSLELFKQPRSSAAKRIMHVTYTCIGETDSDTEMSQRLRNAIKSETLTTLESRMCVALHSSNDASTARDWLVRHTVGSNDDKIWEIAGKQNLHPWVGIAAPIQDDADWTKRWRTTRYESNCGGKVFCFLPITPIETGLPVHVHGNFAVTRDRRSVKWPCADNESGEAKWNIQLVQSCLSPAYVDTLKRLTNDCRFTVPDTIQPGAGDDDDDKPVCRAYYAWPDITRVERSENSPWMFMVQCMLPLLFEEKLLWSWARGGSWLAVKDAWIMEATCNRAMQAAAVQTEHNRIVTDSVTQAVYAFLLAMNEPVVLLPPSVMATLSSTSDDALKQTLARRTIQPASLRQIIRTLLESSPACQQYMQGKRDVASAITSFILADYKVDAKLSQQEAARIMKDVELLAVFPTLHKTTVRSLNDGSPIYATETAKLVQLLPGLDGAMLDTVSLAKVDHGTAATIVHLAKSLGSNHPTFQLLRDDHVPQLLVQSIQTWSPAFQRGHTTSIAWSADGAANYPPLAWLENVWSWCRDSSLTKNYLDQLEGLPLIPAVDGPDSDRLLCLCKQSTIVSAGDRMEDTVKELLTVAGCTVIPRPPEFVHRAGIIGQYILPFQPTAVVIALVNVVRSSSVEEVNRRVASLSIHASQDLLAFLATVSPNEFTSDQKELLRKLQIYVCHSSGHTMDLVSSGKRHPLLPRNVPQAVLSLKLPVEFVRPTPDGKEESLLEALSCPQLTCDELLVTWLLPTVTWPVNITILNFAMELIVTSKLKKESLQRIRTMAFVPCSPSRYSLARPTDLVDPDDVLAQLYDDSEHCFPHVPEGINEDNWLPGLRMVGLRKEAELTAETRVEVLKDRVSSVSRIMTGSAGQEAAKKRTVNIIKFISRLDLVASCGQYIQEEARCFMAQQRPPSDDYPAMLPWCGDDNNKLYTPEQLVAMPDRKQATLLVGSSALLLDVDLFKAIGSDEKDLLGFGLQTVPDLHNVAIQHLLGLVETLESQPQESVLSESMRRYYDQSCFEVYRYLKAFHDRDGSKSKSIVEQYLTGRDWVWLNTREQCRFVSPHRLLYDLPKDIRPEYIQPYRYQMSDECKVPVFQSFFKAFGSSACLDEKGLVDILHEVRDDVPAGERMSDRQLQLVLDIIRHPSMMSDYDDQAAERSLLLPTSNSTLVDAEHCRFCDCSFLLCPKGQFEYTTVSQFHLLHPDLDESIAKRYNLDALSLHILPSDSLTCTVNEKPVLYFDEIASIHESDSEIKASEELFFKEMLQNAEDAGATQVQFTLDCRHIPDVRKRTLLSEELKQWQAPTLWLHNDAEFTAKDLGNIRQLKTTAKQSNPSLIGHKGLGFGCAYHLTDVPSLVSQERIIFFDPAGKNFGVRSTLHQPVVLVDFIKHQEGVSIFADQFSTYHGICECQVLSPTACKYPGTLFRFPLRSKPSEISSHCPSTVKLRDKLAELGKSMDQLLIFLQHIKEVTIDVIHENGNQELLCHWQAEVNQHIAGDPLADRLLFSTTQRCDGSWIRMCENMVTISRKGEVPPFTVYKLILTDKIHYITRNWLVVGMFGGNASLESAEKLKAETGIARVPWVMLAARFNGRPPCIQPVYGELHRALATSISTRLPLHISAFFQLSATGPSLEEHRAAGQWNASLLKNDVPKAYSLLVSGLKELIEREHTKMTDDVARTVYSVLPLTTLEGNPWTDLQRNVLKEVTSTVPFLWTSVGHGQWVKLTSATILDRQLFHDQRLAGFVKDVLVTIGDSYVGDNTGGANEDLLSRILDLSGRKSCALTCQSFFRDKFMSNLLSLTDEQVDNGLKMLIRLGRDQPDTCSWSVQLLKVNKCVRSQAGQLCFPEELIDPYTIDKRIRTVFKNCPSMRPSDTLRDISGFLSEKKLLLSAVENLPVSLLLQAAKYLAESSTDSLDKQAVSYLCGIIAERIRDNLPGNQFLQDLRTVPFLPVMQRPGDWHLPWKAEESPVFVASIADLVPKCQRAVGSVALLVDIDPDVECSWLFSQCSLDTDSPPSLEDMKQQIQVLTAIAAEIPAHDNQRKSLEVLEVLLNVGRCMDRIYGFMKQHMDSNTDQFDASGFGDMTCIWSDQHAMFKLPCEAAMSAPEGYPDLMPFRFIVDQGHKHTDVFSRLGVKVTLDMTDLHAILSSLHASYQDEKGQRTPLSEEHRDLAIKLIEVLHKLNALTLVPGGELLLPTMKGLMLPAIECTYIDREEFSDLLQGTGSWTELWDNIVHSRLATIAHDLGAESLSTRMLPSESMEYETDDLEFESVVYGQELTDRLAHILEDYPADETIVKELVQNADDAGAGSVKFVLDWRDWRQGTGALLSKEMREWQGPALLAYNDAAFTESDFRNIMKLGGATKKDEPDKIGRFGLGFSSVYHLTDVPSFVSGNYIVFFDPHAKYLGSQRVSKHTPAMKINFVRNPKGLEPFSEQFKPYHNIFGCNMNDAYEGTLFRLPLRSPNTTSEICKTSVDIRDVFKKCWSKLSDMILYLQCVRQIQVYEIRSDDCEPTLLFAGQSTICGDEPAKIPESRQDLRRLHERFGTNVYNYIAAQHTDKLTWSTARIEVSTTITSRGTQSFNNVPASTSNGIETTQDWLMCAGLGTLQSKELTMVECRENGLVPWGGCAIKWNAASDIAEPDLSGIAYSFLPLPIATGLPFHLNACLSMATDRRSLEHTNDGSLKTRWNEAVLSDVIPHTYLHLLESIATQSSQEEQRRVFGLLFPKLHDSSTFSYRACIVESFYDKVLSDGNFAVFWCASQKRWITGKEALFLVDYDMFGDYYPDAVQLLDSLNKPVVEQPPHVRQALREMPADVSDSHASHAMTYRQFYEDVLAECATAANTSRPDVLKAYTRLVQCLVDSYTPTQNDWCLELLCSKLKIPTSHGSLRMARQLIDSDNPVLNDLYSAADDDYFPDASLLASKNRDTLLLQAGLIDGQLPIEYVKERAESVPHLERAAALQRCISILQYLKYLKDISKGKDSSALVNTAQLLIACPILPVSQGLPTYTFDCTGSRMPGMYSAKSMYRQQHIHICGSQELLLDEALLKKDLAMTDSQFNEIMALLELKDKVPSTSSIVRQFTHIVAATTSDDNVRTDKSISTTVMKVCSELGARLKQLTRDDLPENSVWIKDQHCFVEPCKAVHILTKENRWYTKLLPYCYVVNDLSTGNQPLPVKARGFFEWLGVRDKLGADDLVAIVRRIRAELHQELLSDEQLEICQCLLRHLADMVRKEPGTCTAVSGILLPTMSKHLIEPRSCTYLDSDFFDSELLSNSGQMHNLARLPAEAARTLGAEPMTKHLLNRKPLGFTYNRKGQAEPLTIRLRNLLREYPMGITVLKELVQNADDAGASRITFLLDARHHGTETLFNPGMAEWQGPALLCFNDAKFAERDFRNILRLGGATKLDSREKIGQFGLGFSSVYNLTDVPSFISDRYLVLLDPHAENLGELVDIGNPGMTVDFVTQQSQLQSFKDQLAPYDNIMGCRVLGDNLQPYEHTLFRFPLRTEATAKRSDIREGHSTTVEEIKTVLLNELCNEAERFLLFLQSVGEISVHIIDDNCKLSADQVDATQVFSCRVTEIDPITDNDGCCRTALECRRAMKTWVEGYSSKTEAACAYTKHQTQHLLTMEAEYMQTRDHARRNSQWLISCGSGHGRAIAGASTAEGREKRVVPWGGVAIKLNGDKTMQRPDPGKVFCFLPLPQSQPFPVHINAFFAVASSRRDIEHADDEKFGSQWNKSLLEDPVTSSYLKALFHWTRLAGLDRLQQNDMLLSAMPHLQDSTFWQALPISFLHLLLDTNAPALFWLRTNGGGEWMNAASIKWVDCKKFRSHATSAITLLQALEIPALALPEMYRKHKEEFDVVDFQTFYRDYFFCEGERIPNESHALFLKLLLDQKEDWSRELLKSEKCIRSSSGDMVACSQVVDRKSRLSQLYLEDDGKFAAKCYEFEPEHLLVLQQCGMIHETLPNEEIIGRAKSVSDASPECEKDRACLLLELLSTPGYIEQISTIKSELQHIEFLPVAPKPTTYHMSWAGDGQSFVSAAESQTMEFVNLAGSVKPLVDLNTGKHHSHLAKCLGYSTPTLNTVLEQLDIMLSENKELQERIEDEEMVLQQLCNQRATVQEHKLAFLQDASTDIYTYLNTAAEKSDVSKSTEVTAQASTIKGFLCSRAWFFHLGHFVRAETLNCRSIRRMGPQLNHPPFFNSVSVGHRSSRNLWQLLDITDKYSPEYMLRVMSIIYEVYNTTSVAEDANRSAEYNNLCKLLCQLAELLVEEQEFHEEFPCKIVLPAKNGHLYYLGELSYNDTPWLDGTEEQLTSDGSLLVLAHPSISWHLAEKLSMERAASRLVKSEGLDFGLEFGQQERLCDRLAGILEKYPSDVSIFKELIQDADDAGATAMHFILDKRADYPNKKLLNPNTESWKQLQRCPSLCVYNNRSFTDKDIAGISKLGSGSKRDDSASTGRFGIGFNAVYHLTDCPSFLSRGDNGTNLCFFDPLLEFEPSATCSEPGRCFNVTPEREEQFCDQFSPYLGEVLEDAGATVSESTVFRLPLRGHYKTKCKIGKDPKEWTVLKIERLFNQLGVHGVELLLFLKNIVSIKVSVLTTTAGNVYTETLYHISRTNMRDELSGLARHASGKDWRQQTFVCSQQETCLQTHGPSVRKEQWLMMRCSGVDLTQPPLTKVQANLSTDEAIKEGLRHGLSPQAGVAVRLSVPSSQAGEEKCSDGKVFTTLPTQIQSGFPVHVNGNFLLDDSRKHLDNVRSGAGGIRAWWNDWLIASVALPAYLQLLSEARQFVTSCHNQPSETGDSRTDAGPTTTNVRTSIGHRGDVFQTSAPRQTMVSASLDWYYSLFPRAGGAKGDQWKLLCHLLYEELAKPAWKVLASHHADPAIWEPWRPCTGPELGVFHSQMHRKEAKQELFLLVVGIDVPLTQAPYWLLEEFNASTEHKDSTSGGQAMSTHVFAYHGAHAGPSGASHQQEHPLDSLKQSNGSSQKTREDVATKMSPKYLRAFLRHNAAKLIKDQVLGRNEANPVHISWILNYCLSLAPGIEAPPDKHRAEFDKIATGLPLLLTQSNKLRIFSEAEPAILTKFPSLIADRLDTVVNIELLSLCKVLQQLLSLEKSGCTRLLSLGDIASSVPTLHSCLIRGVAVCHQPEESLTDWLSSLWQYILANQQQCTWDALAAALPNVCFISAVSVQGDVCVELLVSPQKAARILKCGGDSSIRPDTLLSGLAKLGMYLPSTNHISLEEQADASETFSTIAAGCTAKDDMDRLIKELAQVDFSALGNKLTAGEADKVLRHFIDLCREHKSGIPMTPSGYRDVSDSQRMILRHLPIYPAVGGKRVQLAGVAEFFQLDDELPTAGYDKWCQDRDKSVQVLERLDYYTESFLTECLGLRKLSQVDVLTKLIIPALMLMTEGDRVEHLRCIQDKILPIQDGAGRTTVLTRLKPVPFVTAADGQQRVASELFKHDTVFDAFVDPGFFANEFWHGNEWWRYDRMKLLQELGLAATVNYSRFIDLAKSIEYTWCGGQPARGLKSLSVEEGVAAGKLLIATFNSLARQSLLTIQTQPPNHDKDHKAQQEKKIRLAKNFMRNVSSIKFVFPVVKQDFLPNLLSDSVQHLEQYSRTVPVSLSEAVPYKCYNIAWTVQPVSSKKLELGRETCAHLEISHEPDVRVVLAHFCHLMQAFTARTFTLSRIADGCEQDREHLKNIITQLYTYLNAKCQQADMYAIKIREILQDKPCILADDNKLLLPPGQVTRDSLHGIRTEPYLSTLPRGWEAFPHLMSKKCLHISDTLTAEQCALALRLIKQAYPSEKSTFHVTHDANVYQLIRFCFLELVRCIRSNKIPSVSSAASVAVTNAPQPPTLGEIFLPAVIRQAMKDENYATISLLKVADIVMNNRRYYFRRMTAFNELQFLATYVQKELEAEMARDIGVQLLSEVVSEDFDDDEIDRTENVIYEYSDGMVEQRPDELHAELWNRLDLLKSPEFSHGIRRLLKDGGNDPRSCDDNLVQLWSARVVVVRMIQTILKYNGRTIEGSEQNQSCHYKIHPRLAIFIRNEITQDPADQYFLMKQLAEKISDVLCDKKPLLEIKHLTTILFCASPSDIEDALTREDIAEYNDESIAGVDYSSPPLGEEVPTDLDLFDPSEKPEELYFGQSELVVFHNDQEDVYILAKIIRETTPPGTSNLLARTFLIDIGAGSEKIVSVNDLYRFTSALDRQHTAATQMAIFTGVPSARVRGTSTRADQSSQASQDSELSMDEAGAKIKEDLRAVFSVKDAAERKKVFRRMQMRWHPDQHPGQEPLYTEAFQYLMNLHEHVSKGGSIDSFDCRMSSGASRSSRDWDTGDLFGRFRRGWHSSSHYSGYTGSSSSSHRWRGSRGGHGYHSFFRHASSHYAGSSRPGCRSRVDARRYLKQAESDVILVQEQILSNMPKNNALACFVAQQAVEKALKAALYVAECGLTEENRSLNDVLTLALHLRQTAGCEGLLEHAKVVSPYYIPTRYPDAAHAQCPCENFSADDAQRALQAAEQTVAIVNRFVQPRL